MFLIFFFNNYCLSPDLLCRLISESLEKFQAIPGNFNSEQKQDQDQEQEQEQEQDQEQGQEQEQEHGPI